MFMQGSGSTLVAFEKFTSAIFKVIQAQIRHLDVDKTQVNTGTFCPH